MSRCFPFPPPGYEWKIKADDPSLLKKDKHGEKNHKKEKKDKEKKEGKEKFGKERTDEKRREKKDKKEKHKDKREKERDLYKDKHKRDGSCPDEKRAAMSSDGQFNISCKKSNGRGNDGSVTSGEKRVALPPVFNNGVPVGKNNHLASQTKIFNNIAGSVRSNTNEERSINNQLPDKNICAERRKNGVVKFAPGETPLADGKDKTNEQPCVQKMDRLDVFGEVKFSGNVLGQNVGPVKLPRKSQGPLADGRERKEKRPINGRMDGLTVSGEVRSSDERTVSGEVRSRSISLLPNFDGKAENKIETIVSEKEGCDTKEEKIKEDSREKTMRREKDGEKKKEEKVKETGEQKNRVQMPSKREGNENHLLIPGAKNENKKDLSATLSEGVQRIPKPSSQGEGTLLGKRKDIGHNGIYDEQMTGLNKLARTTTPTHPLTENGRSLEPCQNSAASARPPLNIKVERTFAPDETQRPLMSMEVDGEDCKINDVKTIPVSQSSRTTSRAERKSHVSAKPPHPDTKYLSQVLTVPKYDEWPEWDDQEWLFSSNSSQTKRPQAENFSVEEPTVWARAFLLEPVDVFALPYVIPL
ncbi:hypothetical protein vseg_012339 [Gypsophila vaccaria]